MQLVRSTQLAAMVALIALGCFLVAADANARGGSGNAETKKVAAIKWKCDAKNLATLNDMIKKGMARKLTKKDIDAARYRYAIAKRALQDKDSILCVPALKSGGLLLAMARPPKVAARSCPEELKTLANMISYGVEGNGDAKRLSAAEAQLAKAKKALKLKGRTTLPARNGLCLKHADAGKAVIAEVHKTVKAKIEAVYAARIAKCNKRGARICSSKRRKRIKRNSPQELFLCNTTGFAVLNAEIATGQLPKARAVAMKHLAAAKPARSARQWDKCLASLKAGLKAFANAREALRKVANAKQYAAEKARLLETARKCHYEPHKRLVRLLKYHGKGLGISPGVLDSAAVIESKIIIGRIYCKQALSYKYSAADMPHLEKIRNFKKTIAAKSSVSLKPNADIPGAQFKTITLRGGGARERAEDCRFLCQADQRCKSFTFAPQNNTSRPRFSCYLKAFSGNSVSAHGVTSGMKTPK